MSDYATVPPGCTLKVERFKLCVHEQDLSDFKTLLRLSKLAPETYENLHTDDGKYGVSHEWMTGAKEYWLNKYDWHVHSILVKFIIFQYSCTNNSLHAPYVGYILTFFFCRRATERYNNSFPNFIAEVPDIDNEIFRIHFVALFSKVPNAIPILFMHGWPGSHLEHLGLFDIYRSKFTPDDLPYHVIAVSLPGWTLSSGPPLNKNFAVADIARVMNSLMVGLGFGAGYVCQGGDVGSITARFMAAFHEECKGTKLTQLYC
jgi:microsomal epoxide hydrolase